MDKRALLNRKQRRADIKLARHVELTGPQATTEIFAAAIEHAQAGRLDEVVNCFRKAIKIAPDFAAAHYNLGNALGQQGRLDEAIIHFYKAIELEPGFSEAHSNLGAALKHKGQLDEAMLECRKAIELAPKFPVAHFNLGNIFEEQRFCRKSSSKRARENNARAKPRANWRCRNRSAGSIFQS